MKTLKAQVIISLITCFFLVLAVTICKGNKFGNILSESENTTESQTGTSGILRHTDDGVQIISTRQLTKDINGYGGNVPLVKDCSIVVTDRCFVLWQSSWVFRSFPELLLLEYGSLLYRFPEEHFRRTR